jgi:hypothetical protein
MKKVFTISILLLLSFVTTVSYATKKVAAPLKSAQDEFPVLFSSDDDSEEYWYYVEFTRRFTESNNFKVWSAKTGTNVVYQLPMTARDQAQHWKFVGDAEDCYIVNRITGYNMILVDAAFTDDLGDEIPGNTYVLGEGTPTHLTFKQKTEDSDGGKAGDWGLVVLGTAAGHMNDRSGSTVCRYGWADSGSAITFDLAEEPILGSLSDSIFIEVPVGETGKGSLSVNALNLTEDIALSISGPDAAAFSFPATLPAESGPVVVNFSPTEARTYSATLTLTSTGKTLEIRLMGNGFAWSELPTISPEDGSNDHWYYIKVFRKAAANTAFSLSDTTQMIVQDTLKTGAIRDDQQWKVCGSWEDGFYFINKATGEEMYYNETASEIREADRYYSTTTGDLFDFVRFSDNGVPTADWQLRNRDFAERNPTATKIYINDWAGKHFLNYNPNDIGNRLSFVPVDAPSISSVATVPFEVPKGDYAEYNLSIFGLNLTANITAAISGDEDNVFSIIDNITTLPADGGKLTIAFAPTADKKYTATLTLTSGATTVVIPITGNSDLNVPTISTNGNEAWYYIGFDRAAGDNLVWTVVPDEETGLRYDTRIKQTTLTEGNRDQQWKLVGDWVKGYQIINRNGGAFYFLYDPASGAGESSTARGLLIEEEALGDTVLFKRQNATAKWQWEVKGKNDGDAAHNYLNDYYKDEITVWTVNDGGNPLVFTPIGGSGISTPAGDVDGAIVSVKYYNLMGREVLRPATTGIYIIRNTYASGKVKATKQLFVVK